MIRRWSRCSWKLSSINPRSKNLPISSCQPSLEKSLSALTRICPASSGPMTNTARRPASCCQKTGPKRSLDSISQLTRSPVRSRMHPSTGSPAWPGTGRRPLPTGGAARLCSYGSAMSRVQDTTEDGVASRTTPRTWPGASTRNRPVARTRRAVCRAPSRARSTGPVPMLGPTGRGRGAATAPPLGDGDASRDMSADGSSGAVGTDMASAPGAWTPTVDTIALQIKGVCKVSYRARSCGNAGAATNLDSPSMGAPRRIGARSAGQRWPARGSGHR